MAEGPVVNWNGSVTGGTRGAVGAVASIQEEENHQEDEAQLKASILFLMTMLVALLSWLASLRK
jgi:hypothetical protein